MNPISGETENALQSMLSDGLRYATNYLPSNNSDHLPMTLCAMQGLGAVTGQLEAFREGYATRLHEIDVKPPLPDWKSALGIPDQYPALLATFQGMAETQQDPTPDVLQSVLPGLSMEAFHPIIRLGYALDFASSDEQSAALAYLVSTFRDLPVDTRSPIDLEYALLQQVEAGPVDLRSNRFSSRIMELEETGSYPVGTTGDLAKIAAVVLPLYRSTRNFFALHLVTATQAVRQIVDRYPAVKDQAIAALTGAVLASHRVLGSPAFSEVRPVPAELDPEHAYKYTWVCLSEYGAYGDEIYLEEIAAFVTAGLVPAWVADVLTSVSR